MTFTCKINILCNLDIFRYYFLLFIEIFSESRLVDNEQLQTELDKRIFVTYATTFKCI